MSRDRGAFARRRESLLAGSVLASTVLVSLGGLAVNLASPTAQALAASVCPATTVAVCVGDSTGEHLLTPDIRSVTLGNGTGPNAFNSTGSVVIAPTTPVPLTVTLGSASSIITTSGPGLEVNNGNAPSGASITVIDNGVISAVGVGASGLELITSGTGHPIVAQVNNAVTGEFNGVSADAAGVSDITITLADMPGNVAGDGGNLTAGASGGSGVFAESIGGNVTVTAGLTGNSTTLVSGAEGIRVSTLGAGNITVQGTDAVLATNGSAIDASTIGNGTVNVFHTGSSVQSLAGGDAISAQVGDGGTVNIGSASARITTGNTTTTGIAGTTNGIEVEALEELPVSNAVGANLNVFTGAGLITSTGGAGFAGIKVMDAQSGSTVESGEATVDAQGTNITSAGDGINVQEFNANSATVNYGLNGTGGVINAANGSGIVVESTGVGGNVAIAVGGAGVAINAGGNGPTSAGIFGNATGATRGGALTITTGQGSTIGVAAGDGNLTYGIDAVSNDGGNVTVTSGSTIGASAANGVKVTGIAGSTSGTGAVSITTTGAVHSDDTAISAGTADGAATVAVLGNATITGGFGVIAAASGAGNVSVEIGGNATAIGQGASQDGVLAQSFSGGVKVVADTGSDIEFGQIGIQATSLSGPVSIVANGTIGVTVADQFGVNGIIDSGAGNLTIAVGPKATIDGVQGAVNASSAGLGNVDVTTAAGSTLNGNIATGLSAVASGGNVSVQANGAVNAGSFGILAETFGSGGQTLTIGTGGPIAAGSVGVLGENLAAGSGAAAGNSTIDAIKIVTGGAIGSAATATGSDGIAAVVGRASNNDNIFIDVGGGNLSANASVFATQTGVFAETAGGGDVTILTEAGDTVTSLKNTGISALGDQIAVTAAAGVDSLTGIGILTSATGDTTIAINSGTTSGIGNSTLPVIEFVNNTANTTTTIGIGAAGKVEANGASPTGRAILSGGGNATVGSVVVNDAGALIGEVNFGSMVGNGTAGNATIPANISNTAVNVLSGGVWTTSGADLFGAGALGAGNATVASDTATTAGTGVINTIGATNLVFGNTTANSLGNGGVLRVGSDGAASTLTLTGRAIALTNAGLIDLSTGAAGADSIVGTTTAFTGVAGGEIATKANLAGAGNSLANSLTVASTAGSNSIKVTDAGGTAQYVPLSSGGIVLVRTAAAGDNNAAFSLNPNSTGYATFGPNAAGLLKGLWLYTLANTNGDEVLVSSAGPGAFEAPIVATAAQDIWYAASPWQDRQADLRDSALLAPGSLGSFTPGVWIKAVGDWSGRTDKIDPPAGFTFDLDYRQDTYGVVGGIDGAARIGSGVGLIGVAGGYLNSQVDFASHVGLADQSYDGGTASVYATYIQDQFFIDGQVKGDFLTLRASAFGGSGSTSVDTYGGQVDAGYRLPIGVATLEPTGALAYAVTDIGAANVGGTVVRYGDEDSFRGALGGRISAPLVSNDSYLVKGSVDGRVWDEFEGDNKVSLISALAGTPAVGVNDNFSGVFGEVGGALDLYSKDGHSSAFISGSYKFKTDYNEGKVAIGYRYQWGAPAAPLPPHP